MHLDDYWNSLEMDRAIRAYHDKQVAPMYGKLPEDAMEDLRESYVQSVYQSPVALWAIAKWWAKEGIKVND